MSKRAAYPSNSITAKEVMIQSKQDIHKITRYYVHYVNMVPKMSVNLKKGLRNENSLKKNIER
jgi:hypothetical protein